MRFEIPGRPMPKQRPRVGRYETWTAISEQGISDVGMLADALLEDR